MSFAKIYGHSRQIDMLRQTMTQGRVAHSYLFSGPDAIGKKTVALAFAAALNCADAAGSDACGVCASCRKMTSGHHPDLHLLATQAQFLRIDAVRGIQEQMAFKPLEGRRRIFILDDADKMNEQAANALLKTLEEPSADNILLLVTARPYWLPQTILSRCRHVRFSPLSVQTVARFLTEQKKEEPSRAAVLASLSGGSIGRALELNSEETMAFREALGRLLSDADQGALPRPIALASFLAQDKREIRRGLAILKSFFRDALVFRETAAASMTINADALPLVSALAARLTGEDLLHNIALVDKAHETIEMNVNKSLTLEAMAFKLHL
ncbi:MAG: DNA polymerase III subunit delta' [Deltaproteobacteria bacterium]|nr:DNA polymerase III subunit delta' [Deltaproteobacteria bacterium]